MKIFLLLLLILGLPIRSNASDLDVTCTGELKRMEFNDPDDDLVFIERFVISDKFELASHYQQNTFDEWNDPGTAEYKESPDSFVITFGDPLYDLRTTVTINKKDPAIASIWDQGADSLEYESYTCVNN